MAYTKNHTWIVPYQLFVNFGNQPLSLVDFGDVPAGKSLSGSYNPEWREQVAAGTNAATAMSAFEASYEPGNLSCFAVIQNNTDPSVLISYGAAGQLRPNGWRQHEPDVPSDILTEVTNRAIRKFLDAADSARSSIEFGQDLGEWRETVRGFTHPLQSLREFTFSHLAKVKKLTRTVKHKALLSKMVADTWLEFNFGWRPLAQDVYEGAKGLLDNKHLDVQRIGSTATGTYPVVDLPNSGGTSIGGGIVFYRLRVTGAYSVHFYGAIRTGAVDHKVGVLQALQLDLPHFVPTIWDLLPYSWVVDYFTNAGDILKALSFRDSNLVWGNKTVRNEYLYHWDTQLVMNNYDTFSYHLLFQEDLSVNPSGLVKTVERGALQPGDLIPKVRISLPLGSLRPWENLASLFLGRQQEITRIASNKR
jgi:hypothetical protein